MRFPRLPIFQRNAAPTYDEEPLDIVAMRASAKRGRQRCGMLLASCFVIAIGVVASIVWSLNWGDREFDSLIPPPTPFQQTQPPILSPSATTTSAPSPTPLQPSVGCNGLESLCNVPLNEIIFATVHNAAATSDVQIVAPNHDRSLLEALQAGYRGLNIDLGLCNGELSLVHTSCALGTDDVAARFQEIADFITTTRPRDVLMVTLELNMQSGGPFSVDFLADWIRNRVPDFANLLYVMGPNQQVWPTPQQLRAAGTPIVLFHYGAERCAPNCPAGYHEWFDYAVETPFSFDTTNELLQNTANSCALERGIAGRGVFYGINVFTRIPSSFSCQVLNSRMNLQQHLITCMQQTGRPVTMVLVDCWDQGDVLAVVQDFNAARTSQ